MSSETLDFRALTDRLEPVEKRSRRLAVLGATALASAIAAVGLSAYVIREHPGEPDGLPPGFFSSVRATEFNLADASGNTLAKLGVSGDGSPSLILWDPRWDEHGNSSHAELGTKDGLPALRLVDRDKNERAALRLLQDGSPSLELRDPSGQVVWSMPGQVR